MRSRDGAHVRAARCASRRRHRRTRRAPRNPADPGCGRRRGIMTLLRHVPHPFAQALLTQPRRVQGDRALRALTSSFAAVAGYREPSAVSGRICLARSLPVHHIVGISALCVLHRLTVTIHILHWGIRCREREQSTACATNFQVYPHPATCYAHSAPHASPTRVHPCACMRSSTAQRNDASYLVRVTCSL